MTFWGPAIDDLFGDKCSIQNNDGTEVLSHAHGCLSLKKNYFGDGELWRIYGHCHNEGTFALRGCGKEGWQILSHAYGRLELRDHNRYNNTINCVGEGEKWQLLCWGDRFKIRALGAESNLYLAIKDGVPTLTPHLDDSCKFLRNWK